MACRICGATFNTRINCARRMHGHGGRWLAVLMLAARADLTEPVDVYCEWIDALEANSAERAPDEAHAAAHDADADADADEL